MCAAHQARFQGYVRRTFAGRLQGKHFRSRGQGGGTSRQGDCRARVSSAMNCGTYCTSRGPARSSSKDTRHSARRLRGPTPSAPPPSASLCFSGRLTDASSAAEYRFPQAQTRHVDCRRRRDPGLPRATAFGLGRTEDVGLQESRHEGVRGESSVVVVHIFQRSVAIVLAVLRVRVGGDGRHHPQALVEVGHGLVQLALETLRRVLLHVVCVLRHLLAHQLLHHRRHVLRHHLLHVAPPGVIRGSLGGHYLRVGPPGVIRTSLGGHYLRVALPGVSTTSSRGHYLHVAPPGVIRGSLPARRPPWRH
eukprot:5986-Prorocentrum_minimum.AAC.2